MTMSLGCMHQADRWAERVDRIGLTAVVRELCLGPWKLGEAVTG